MKGNGAGGRHLMSRYAECARDASRGTRNASVLSPGWSPEGRPHDSTRHCGAHSPTLAALRPATVLGPRARPPPARMHVPHPSSAVGTRWRVTATPGLPASERLRPSARSANLGCGCGVALPHRHRARKRDEGRDRTAQSGVRALRSLSEVRRPARVPNSKLETDPTPERESSGHVAN